MMQEEDAIVPEQEVKEQRRSGRNRSDYYQSVGNDSPSSSSVSDGSWLWVKILLACTIALSIDVIITMLYIFRFDAPPYYTQQQGQNNVTLPWRPLPSEDRALSKIAFGSCSEQTMPMPYWDTVVDYSPDILLLMGDNVYGDCENMSCERLHQAYQTFASHPSVMGAASMLSVFPTLDDHDYGQADCHGDNNPHKDLARQLFVDFFGIDDLPPDQDGVYRAGIWGPPGRCVQIILLDTRYARSAFLATGIESNPYRPIPDNDTETKQQMLSETQWSWLANQLSKDANLRFIVSSVQVLNDITGFECWRQLPRERQRLYNLVANKNVVFLSGDRHVGSFSQYNDTAEMTASSWTHTIPFGAYDNCSTALECDEPDPRRVGDLVRVNHFGTIDINWEESTFVMALRRAETTYGAKYLHKDQLVDDKRTDAGSIIISHVFDIPLN